MKKQFVIVLLAIVFVSSNLFAIRPDERLKDIDKEFEKSKLSYSEYMDDQYHKLDNNESVEQENTRSFVKASRQLDKQMSLEQRQKKHVGRNKRPSTGQKDPWEIRRDELADYVLDSYWITWKLLSAGDVQMGIALTTLIGEPFKVAATLFSAGKAVDEVEEFILGLIINNKGKTLDPIRHVHDVDRLYVRIQRNAFNLLLITKDDYYNVIKKYPEVAYLFEDLYTFFKWRNQLHQYYKDSEHDLNDKEDLIDHLQAANDYRYNDYFFYKIFREAVNRNSFEGWWELANIAKEEMIEALSAELKKYGIETTLSNLNQQDIAEILAKLKEQGVNLTNLNLCLSTQTADQEEDNMRKYKRNASSAEEAGRLWNGIQRYAAIRLALPLKMYPRKGAGTLETRKDIRADMKKLSLNKMRKKFENHRSIYLDGSDEYPQSGRNDTEVVWQTLYKQFKMASYQCTPADGQTATPKKRMDVIQDDFTFADEIVQKLSENIIKM